VALRAGRFLWSAFSQARVTLPIPYSLAAPWPVSNNPAAKYNALDRIDCNLRIPLWQFVRGSTAAPTYFPPEVGKVGEDEFIFVDGGVTMYNNPAFQLFLMAPSRRTISAGPSVKRKSYSSQLVPTPTPRQTLTLRQTR
jgi:hypothetical protein